MKLRKAIWILKGKSIQSILHILLMVIFASTLLTGMVFKETGEFIKSGGTFYYSVKVMPKNPESYISQATIEQLADNPDIAGYNYNVLQKVQLGDFKNWVEYYKNNDSDNDDLAELSINLNVEFSDIFANNTAELIKGGFPNEKEHGIVIEQLMAEHNSIQIGDTIEVITDDNASVLKLRVLGIYRLKSPIEVVDVVGGQSTNTVSPYTRLYTNIESIASSQSGIAIQYVNFYTLKKENVSSILSNFNSEIDDTLEATDSTNTMFVVLNQAIDNMTQYYNWIIYALILTSIVVFILFSVYTQHKNIYETAILSVLGQSNKEILLQNTLNVTILSTISNVISTIMAFTFLNSAGLFWIFTATQNYTIGVTDFSFRAEQTALINNYTINNFGLKIILVVLVIFFISILITVVYSISVLRIIPRKRMDRAS